MASLSLADTTRSFIIHQHPFNTNNTDPTTTTTMMSIQDCDCGFIDFHDPSQTTFTHLLLVDFTQTTLSSFNTHFIPAAYNVTKPTSPYIRSYTPQNVLLTPSGLELTCSESTNGITVPSAGIFTRERSFFYGSYRAEIVLEDEEPEPGTVTGFFYYKNDTSEIDVEFLSARRPQALQFSVKPQIYEGVGGRASRATMKVDLLDDGGGGGGGRNGTRKDGMSTDIDVAGGGGGGTGGWKSREWNFIWKEDSVAFGHSAPSPPQRQQKQQEQPPEEEIKKKRKQTVISTNIPSSPGRLMLNHWSDGNVRFSQGPPQRKSRVVVRRLQGVYNDAVDDDGNLEGMVCQKMQRACVVGDGGIVWGQQGEKEKKKVVLGGLGASDGGVFWSRNLDR